METEQPTWEPPRSLPPKRQAQLGSVPAYAFLTSAQRLSLVGVTPMVGLNDIPREVFTLADATKVGAFARANGLAGLGWGGR